MFFTVEETNLMCCFDTSSRKRLIAEMKSLPINELDDELAELGKSFGYEYWERVDETHSGVRFCASWATTQEHVDALRAAVQALRK